MKPSFYETHLKRTSTVPQVWYVLHIKPMQQFYGLLYQLDDQFQDRLPYVLYPWKGCGDTHRRALERIWNPTHLKDGSITIEESSVERMLGAPSKLVREFAIDWTKGMTRNKLDKYYNLV